MSIIYNALEKTQKNRESNRETEHSTISKPSTRRPLPWMRVMTIAAVSCLAIFTIKHYPSPAKPLPIAANKPSSAITKIKQKNKLILNGVFLSDVNKIAMINHQSFTLGDQINGMTVVHISMNSVKLRDEKNTMVLHTIA